MKKLLMAAVAASALAATPALADTVSTYAVTGSVGEVCSANTSGTIAFGALTDGNGALTATSQSANADTGAYCNGAATTVEVTHSDLKNTTVAAGLVTSPPSGFTGTVSFVPEVVAGATTITGDKASGTSLGAFSGLTVSATSLSAGGSKPLAGSYSGSIVITLTPGA